jgi:hypothetical protein
VTTTLDGREVSPRLKHPAKGRVLHRLVGVGFAAAAIGNAIGTIRQAPSFCSGWLMAPGYRPTHGCFSIWPTGPTQSSALRRSSKQSSPRC